MLLGTVVVAFMLAFSALSQMFPVQKVYAQYPSGMTSVNGTFVDKAGYSITFPDGWSGFTSKFGASVVPGGFQNMKNFSQIAMISVGAMNRTVIADTASKFASMAQQFSSLGGSAQMKSLAESYYKACSMKYAYTTINGFSAFRSTSTCDFTKVGISKNATLSFMKQDMVMVATDSNFVVLAYSTFSADADQKYYNQFTQSLTTFHVDNVEDVKNAMDQLTGTILKTLKVNAANNTPIDLPIASNSQVSNVSVNSGSKTLSFQVDGGSANSGMSRIAVDKVLDGPYTVTIDGNQTQNVMEATDDQTHQTYLTINYPASHHDIVIEGTQVVPEFPFVALVVPLGVLMPILLYRVKLFRNKPV